MNQCPEDDFGGYSAGELEEAVAFSSENYSENFGDAIRREIYC
jgi:hypothetical protein